MKDPEVTQESLEVLALYKKSKTLNGGFKANYIGGTLGAIAGAILCMAFEENFQGGFPEEAHITIIALMVVVGVLFGHLVSLYWKIRAFNTALKEFCITKSGLSKETISLWID